MKTNDVLKVLGVAAVAVIGYYYYMSLDDYDEYFDNDYDGNGDDGDSDCSTYIPFQCGMDGDLTFVNEDGVEIAISERCCNAQGYEWGGVAGGRNACLCPSSGNINDKPFPTTS